MQVLWLWNTLSFQITAAKIDQWCAFTGNYGKRVYKLYTPGFRSFCYQLGQFLFEQGLNFCVIQSIARYLDASITDHHTARQFSF